MRPLSVLVLVPAFLCSTIAAAQQPERFQLRGQEAAVYNLVGAVTVEPGTGELAVEVTRTGRDGGQLKVEQGDVRGGEALRVIYPADNILAPSLGAGSSTTLRVREDGTFGDGDWDGGRRHRDRDDRGRRVEIRGSGSGLDAGADLRIRVPAGRQLALYLAVGKVSLTNVQGDIRVDASSAPVTASGVKGELTIDVGSGPVRVTDGQGVLNVDTGSGSVEVSRFKGRDLVVDTGSGNVNGTELTAEGLSIETGSGDIEVAGVSSPSLSLETGSGTVRADLRTDIRSLSVETGSGDVAVTAPATLDAEVEIETSSGDIESDFPLQVTRHARDHLVGRIGAGKGRIAVETGSGDVRLIKRPG
jgi:lia operon protein LiaG